MKEAFKKFNIRRGHRVRIGFAKLTAKQRQELGRKGGSTPTSKPKGLAALSREDRVKISSLGGKASKRGITKKVKMDDYETQYETH